MAGSSLLALLDDIATILDDVSVMTKIAAKKTAGVLGDDLALNAEQVSGVKAERELPVVWAVAKGSCKNKLILVPSALAISLLIPWAIVPLLMLGGIFLCFEGVEKLAHKYLHDHSAEIEEKEALLSAAANPAVDLVDFEADKIKGAIRTDFILSAEIIVITLGTVAESGYAMQIAVLCGISAIMTAGVYGLVAGIVKLDDLGLMLIRNTASGFISKIKRSLGKAIIFTAPYLMKTLSVVGTAAMFMVGGGIITHGIHILDQTILAWAENLAGVAVVGGTLKFIIPTLLSALVGIFAGIAALLIYKLSLKIIAKFKS